MWSGCLLARECRRVEAWERKTKLFCDFEAWSQMGSVGVSAFIRNGDAHAALLEAGKH